MNERSTIIKKLRDRFNHYERLETTILSPKEDLEESKKQNKELLQAHEKQENEVLDLRYQLEEGRNVEENMKKQYLEKEEQHQVEVNILKDKLEEKYKLLRFQDSNKILDDILSSQSSPAIKASLGFHESNAKFEILNKEMRGQPHQQPRKEILQRNILLLR